jgi:hypothetical protein
VNEAKVSRIILSSSKLGGSFYKAMYSKSGGGGGGSARRGPPGGPGSAVRHKDGDQVGEGASRIGMENIGHRLLSKMGYVAFACYGIGVACGGCADET